MDAMLGRCALTDLRKRTSYKWRTYPADVLPAFVAAPVYPPFFERLHFGQRHVVEAPLRRDDDGRYDLDLEALDRALAEDGVRAYLFRSPHNPSGRVWSRQQLMAVADLCQRRRRASWPGWTAGHSASATTPPRRS